MITKIPKLAAQKKMPQMASAVRARIVTDTIRGFNFLYRIVTDNPYGLTELEVWQGLGVNAKTFYTGMVDTKKYANGLIPNSITVTYPPPTFNLDGTIKNL